MTTDPYLDQARADAEARMTSRCTIRRRGPRGPQNESTGREAPSWATTYTGLPLRVAGSRISSQTRTESIAGVEVQTALRVAHLPSSTSNLQDGDLLEVTAGELAGSVFRIVEAEWQDQATARRVPVETVARPEEW